MPTPQRGYKNAAGIKIPSVTTILGIINKPALVGWAYKRGKEGLDLYKERDDAMAAGTLAHAMAEADIKGTNMPVLSEHDPLVAGSAATAFDAYLQWKRMTRIELVASEVGLVSEKCGYGGTLDAIGVVDQDLVLVDFKVANDLYWEYVLQVAAYRELWQEVRGEKIHSAHILRFGKEHANFAHHFYPGALLDQNFPAFLAARDLYNYKQQLGKAA